MTSGAPTRRMEVYLLGSVSHERARLLQRKLAYDAGETGAAGLILCEHPPTITVGRLGSRAHILPDDDELRRGGVEIRRANRGGGCVMHLPGQVVGYLSFALRAAGMDPRTYSQRIHSILIETLREFELEGASSGRAPGVFLGNARVGTVGIGIGRGVTSHGFTLNVGPFLGPFRLVRDPDVDGREIRATSMESRRQRPIRASTVRESLIRMVESQLNLETAHLYTDHSLLRGKDRIHVRAIGSQ